MSHSSHDARLASRFASHSDSSAFSSSANPDEDWTKVLDLAERRRIQNRIAQRKKLKRRLEDLERRATCSGPPEQSHAESLPPKSTSRPRPKQWSDTSSAKVHMSRAPRLKTPVSNDYSIFYARTMSGHNHPRQVSVIPPEPPKITYPQMQAYHANRHFYGQLQNHYTASSTCRKAFSHLGENGELLPPTTPITSDSPFGILTEPSYGKDIPSPISVSYASMAATGDPQQREHTEPIMLVQYPYPHLNDEQQGSGS